MELDKKDSKAWMWMIGGVVAAAAAAYAVKRIQVYMAWQEEREFQGIEDKIEQYDDYVHSNGHKRKRWWWSRSEVTS